MDVLAGAAEAEVVGGDADGVGLGLPGGAHGGEEDLDEVVAVVLVDGAAGEGEAVEGVVEDAAAHGRAEGVIEHLADSGPDAGEPERAGDLVDGIVPLALVAGREDFLDDRHQLVAVELVDG